MKSTNKAFIFQYDPYFSPKRMFSEFKEAIDGKKYIQPENVMVANDLSIINRILTKGRLKMLACIKEHQPENLRKLTSLLQRDRTNVWRDCWALANCGIIELKKLKSGEVKPIILYDQIVLDFPVSRRTPTEKPVNTRPLIQPY